MDCDKENLSPNLYFVNNNETTKPLVNNVLALKQRSTLVNNGRNEMDCDKENLSPNLYFVKESQPAIANNNETTKPLVLKDHPLLPSTLVYEGRAYTLKERCLDRMGFAQKGPHNNITPHSFSSDEQGDIKSAAHTLLMHHTSYII